MHMNIKHAEAPGITYVQHGLIGHSVLFLVMYNIAWVQDSVRTCLRSIVDEFECHLVLELCRTYVEPIKIALCIKQRKYKI